MLIPLRLRGSRPRLLSRAEAHGGCLIRVAVAAIRVTARCLEAITVAAIRVTARCLEAITVAAIRVTARCLEAITVAARCQCH